MDTLQQQIDDMRRRLRDLENREKLRQRNFVKRRDPVLRGGGEALVLARKVAQWSQRDLSLALSVRPTTLMRWERNIVPMQRWRVLAAVEVFRASGVPPPAWPIDGWDGTDDLDLWSVRNG